LIDLYTVDIEVDAKYTFCPGPLLKLFEYAQKAKSGQIIKLLATDPATPEDVKNWVDSVGHEFLSFNEKDGVYEIYIRILGFAPS